MAESGNHQRHDSLEANLDAEAERTLALVLNRDLLFGSRIRSALAALGLRGQFVSNSEQFTTALSSHGREFAIAIIDMNGTIDWELLRPGLEGAESPTTLAFGPHVDVEGRRAAQRAGVSRIVSNGQFDREMVALLDRYRRR
jgi:hypothetical protein